jgi:glutamate dehydrogenase/leucine dehydrogenase
MKVFNVMSKYNHEEIVFCQDRDSGLRAIIAIHDTTLGPARGGTRMWPYAPDYVINAGGLINVANELEGYHREKALKEAEGIYNTLKQVIDIARKENIPTGEASNRFAERRIAQAAKLKRMHVLSLPRQIRGERYAW